MEYIKKMIDSTRLDDSIMAIRDMAIMFVLISTGIRREELARLTFNDLDMEQRTILIRGKGDHQREGYIRPDAYDALAEWLNARPEKSKSNAIFISLHPNKKGMYKSLEPNAINKLLIRWREKAQLPTGVSVSPHKWRHTYATSVGAKTKNPYVLKDLLGHTDIRITSGYVHPGREEKRAVSDRYGPEL